MVRDYEYINIAKIKLRHFYSGGILGAKHFFPLPPQKKAIYAN